MREDVDFSQIMGQDQCKSNCIGKASLIDRKSFMAWLISNHQPMSEGHARNLSYYANKILRDAKNCNPTPDEAQGIATSILLGETSKSNKRLKLIALEYWMQFIGQPLHFKKPRATKRNHVYITEEQMRLLIMASKNYRDAVILELLCTTGVRIGELRELDLRDLDFGNGIIKIRHGKGDREREVFMTDECRRFLNVYITKWRIDQGPLFLSRKGNRMSHNALWNVVRGTALSAGLPNVSPHILRHSYATCFAGKNDNVFVLQELLGHSTIEMTQRYYHSNRETNRKGAMIGAPTILTHG